MRKKKWYDYLWIMSVLYLVLGVFNISFAWLGFEAARAEGYDTQEKLDEFKTKFATMLFYKYVSQDKELMRAVGNDVWEMHHA